MKKDVINIKEFEDGLKDYVSTYFLEEHASEDGIYAFLSVRTDELSDVVSYFSDFGIDTFLVRKDAERCIDTYLEEFYMSIISFKII